MNVDRFHGCMLGLAVGDALGATLEFKPPGTFDPISEIVGGGPFSLKPGQWTDDTSMALCLAASLTERGGFDAHDQMKRFVRWWREGYMSSRGECFDIGTTVRSALMRFEKFGDPFSGSVAVDTAGNGSLMRLAPVPLFFARDSVKAIELAGDSSRTTHGAKTTVDACRYFAGLIVGALNGVPKSELLGPCYSPLPDFWKKNPLHDAIASVASGSFKAKDESQIRASGYVVESLEAALWAFHRGRTFRECVELSVNLGRDADTTGAICGQIAGAFYGSAVIPTSWSNAIFQREMILDLAGKLFVAASTRPA